MATNTTNTNTNKEVNTEARKHYYIAFRDTSTNEVLLKIVYKKNIPEVKEIEL